MLISVGKMWPASGLSLDLLGRPRPAPLHEPGRLKGPRLYGDGGRHRLNDLGGGGGSLMSAGIALALFQSRGGAFMSRILLLAASLVVPLVLSGCVHVHVPVLHIP
jgi:hypothetical protein